MLDDQSGGETRHMPCADLAPLTASACPRWSRRGYVLRTVTTGQGAVATSRLATLPTKNFVNPVLP